MDRRPTWTDCDEAGDYVVPNVLSPRDLVFRPDNMDETVPHTPRKCQMKFGVNWPRCLKIMVIYIHIALGQGQTTSCGNSFLINRIIQSILFSLLQVSPY